MAFMTTTDVQDILPGVCTDDNLKIAILVIEGYAGCLLDGSYNFTVWDLAQLKKAVAFQAMWLNSQDDYLARLGTDSFSIDGASMSASGQHKLFLAPLARKCVRNLSWFNASVKPRSSAEVAEYIGNRFLNNHTEGPWTVL